MIEIEAFLGCLSLAFIIPDEKLLLASQSLVQDGGKAQTGPG